MPTLKEIIVNSNFEDVKKEALKEMGKNYIVKDHMHVLNEIFNTAQTFSPKGEEENVYLRVVHEEWFHQFYGVSKIGEHTFSLEMQPWDIILSLEIEPETLKKYSKEVVIFVFLKHAFHEGRNPEHAEFLFKRYSTLSKWLVTYQSTNIQNFYTEFHEYKKRDMLRMAKENKDILAIFDGEKKTYIYDVRKQKEIR